MPPKARNNQDSGIGSASAYALLEEAGEDASSIRAAAARTAAAAPAAKPAAPKPAPAKPAPAAPWPQSTASAAPARVQIVPKTGGKRSDDYYRAFQLLYVDERTRDVVLRFHKTDIVRITPKGDVYLYNGGFFTATTLYSINDALYPLEMELTSRGNASAKGWTIVDNYGYSIPYVHNVVIPARKEEDRNRGKWVLDAYGAPDPSPAGGSSKSTATAAPSAPAVAAPRPQQAGANGAAANGGGAVGATSSGVSNAAKAVTAAAPGMAAGAWPTPAAAAGAPKAAATAASAAPSVPAYAAAAARGTPQQAASAAPTQAQRPAGWAAASGALPPGYSAGSNAPPAAAAAPAGQPQAGAANRQPPGFAQQGSVAAKAPAAAQQRAAPAGHKAPGAPGGADQLSAQTANLHLEEEGPDDMFCVVCMEHYRDTVLVPCGHMVLCSGCCKDIIGSDNLCPVCRVSISEHCQIRG